ncbi:MAG: glutamine-synthetase adenylyltransferase, partial [Bdellovibrionaceae bacterium]|nr:glutamine-synthetase adenylyltransferase [Pseudobdellovibrionaceae bacterium]
MARYHRSLASGALPEFSSQLRYQRKKSWLDVAVPSLLKGENPEALCKSWSDRADELLKEAFDHCFSGEIALFALGKLGARELNLSSDVDLLIIAKEERPEDLPALRKFQKLLSEVTPESFVFRVDFDLRPGGRMGPLIPTVDHFVDYYGNYGETWERMAFVRLRAIAGSDQVQKKVLDFSARFSFRKHLDYSLFEELKLMRRKIHAEHWKRSEGDSYDLKLGVGGIRDVELFFHALQVIHGGKDASLRTASTSQAAHLLSEKQLLPKEDATFLVQHYWDLRALENFVQAKEDHQTHQISKNEPHLPMDLQKKLDGLDSDLKRTDAIVATLLGEAPKAPSNQDIRVLFEEQKLEEHLQEILAIPLLSRHKERDEQTRRSFLQKFLKVAKEQNADVTLALDQLKDFLKAVRAKSTFFDLLLREEHLLREIAWLFGHSRYLGRLLCFRPELLDSFIFRNQDLKTEDLEVLLEGLAEKKLLNEIIEGSRFLKTHDVPSMTQALTESADSIVIALMEALKKEYPSEASILALGKWGAEETGFRSDLDMIFVHPGNPQETDLRFAKRVISRLTDSHRGGSIYPVDLRLRPSGKAGPLVISWAELQDYL